MSEHDGIVAETLDLGGAFEEVQELILSHAWQDEWRREMLRQQATTNRLLAQIAANTGATPDIPDDIIVQPPRSGGGGSGGDDSEARTDPRYWVTEESITVDNDKYNSETWPFVAKTVVLIFDAPVEVAFLPPGDHENRELELADNQSPFSLSGVDGIFADQLWYRKPDSATNNAALDIIALR